MPQVQHKRYFTWDGQQLNNFDFPLTTNPKRVFFFLRSEGPRSRCYGHTAALRLLVQPL